MAGDPRLFAYRQVWEEKPVLRLIYADYYKRIVALCKPGPTLEIGGGSGNLKSFAPDVVSTDILSAPWLDVLADAQELPFADASFQNIVMFDVLHHIERPRLFLSEAQRVLSPGGRVIVLEPLITPFSSVFYRLFHHEPVRMSEDPLAIGPRTTGRDPYASNQAVPTLLFGRNRSRLEHEFPALKVVMYKPLALLAYPLSGGFRAWSLLPTGLTPRLLRLELWLEPWLGWLSGFRLLACLERR